MKREVTLGSYRGLSVDSITTGNEQALFLQGADCLSAQTKSNLLAVDNDGLLL